MSFFLAILWVELWHGAAEGGEQAGEVSLLRPLDLIFNVQGKKGGTLLRYIGTISGGIRLRVPSTGPSSLCPLKCVTFELWGPNRRNASPRTRGAAIGKLSALQGHGRCFEVTLNPKP